MPILTKEEFQRLSRFDNNPCISIFIPTHRVGKDVLEEKDKIQLKSQWKKASIRLKEIGLGPGEIKNLEEPINKIVEDKNFWRYQLDGLAIFLAKDIFEKFCVPIDFEPFVHVSNQFFLKPLVPIFTGDGQFHILSLAMDHVELYKASRYNIGELELDDSVPSQLEDRVGYDYEEKNSKHQSVAQGSSVTQGFGGAERDRKNEFLRFFRAVDKGIHPILQENQFPLLLCCQDYLFPIYQEANTYNNLFPKSIHGNPTDFENKQMLHAKAVEVMQPYFEEEKKNKMNQFRKLNPERTSKEVKEIIPAVFEGKVDTLFLQKKEELWGNFNENMASVEISNGQDKGSLPLSNLAAVKVIEQGGTVYLMDREFMPAMDSTMNAVYRY